MRYLFWRQLIEFTIQSKKEKNRKNGLLLHGLVDFSRRLGQRGLELHLLGLELLLALPIGYGGLNGRLRQGVHLLALHLLHVGLHLLLHQAGPGLVGQIHHLVRHLTAAARAGLGGTCAGRAGRGGAGARRTAAGIGAAGRAGFRCITGIGLTFLHRLTSNELHIIYVKGVYRLIPKFERKKRRGRDLNSHEEISPTG